MPGFVLVIVGLTIVVLVAILVPLRGARRDEISLDPEDAARALLGEEPPGFPQPDPDADRHREYDPGELRALRNIGTPQAKKARRR